MKRIIAIGVILVAHAGVLVAMYYGRLQAYPLCGSDIFMIYTPLLVAVVAYASVYRALFRTRSTWLRRGLLVGMSVFSGCISTAIGMTIAFNRWGT